METMADQVRFSTNFFGRHRHICAFFNSFGHMEWALTDLPGTEDLIEYETRVNYVIPKYEDTVICTYDLTKFGASAVMDALRTHPVVIIGGLLQENPFYVSPDQLLSEIRQRRLACKSGDAAR